MSQLGLDFWNDVSSLAEKQREDYQAVEIQGRSIREQAAHRGVAPPTVQRNVTVARERLDGGDSP